MIPDSLESKEPCVDFESRLSVNKGETVDRIKKMQESNTENNMGNKKNKIS